MTTSNYGWIVTIDHTASTGNDTTPSCVSMMGPPTMHPAITHALSCGQGRIWRTLREATDPDQPFSRRLVHHGRFLNLNDLGFADSAHHAHHGELGPLTDLSGPLCGATTIQYNRPHGWHTFDTATPPVNQHCARPAPRARGRTQITHALEAPNSPPPPTRRHS